MNCVTRSTIAELKSLPRAMLLTITCVSAAIAQGRPTGEPQKALPREISMGTAQWSLLDSCVTVGSRLSSSEFFEGIVVQRTNGNVRFWKDSKQITEYPSTLNVQLAFIITKCDGRGIEDAAKARSIIEGLLFKVEWKNGLKVWPVREFKSNLRKPSPEELLDRIGEAGARSHERLASLFWIVDVEVKDGNIPLINDLVVTVFDERTRQLARLSARL